MNCPKCESITRVYRTQNSIYYRVIRVIRERRCTSKKCGHRYQTIEILGGTLK